MEYRQESLANFHFQIGFSIAGRSAGLNPEVKNLFKRSLDFSMFSHSVYGCSISTAF